MLQQTQVSTVIPYYERFLARFPDVSTLAAAPVDEVIAHWAGLGYYARARNLHRCAQQVVTVHGGLFPRTPAELAELPGIGPSTAAAIAAFAYGVRAAILDGNVKRVLCRQFGIEGFPGLSTVDRTLWGLAESLLPERDIESYTQGLMDLGATCCTRQRPRCTICPVATRCIAFQQGRQAELPTPRPRKEVPERSGIFAIFRSGERILFERRPPSGLWGGLLTLPEGEVHALAAARGLQTGAMQLLPPLKHAFTHFRLTLQPILCEVTAAPAACEAGELWLTPAEALAGGVPTPIGKILRQLA